ncbi:DUF6875 domain-containing protein [Kitasatospora sp. NPDC054939]
MRTPPIPQELGLLSRADVDSLPSDHPLRVSLQWIEGFVAKPHPKLGRSGVVCPFIPGALKKDTIWFALPSGPIYLPGDIKDIIEHYRGVFEKIHPQSRPESYFKTIVVAFPGVGPGRAGRFIDDVQADLKPHFIARGLMLGEFHSNNTVKGSYNATFYPLRSPFPLLAIRRMVPQDRSFLTGEKVPESKRVVWLKAYVDELQHMPGQEHKAWAIELKELLDNLLEEGASERGDEEGEEIRNHDEAA